jgi:succinate dehydrogenase hydrophobic anchor subunit
MTSIIILVILIILNVYFAIIQRGSKKSFAAIFNAFAAGAGFMALLSKLPILIIILTK